MEEKKQPAVPLWSQLVMEDEPKLLCLLQQNSTHEHVLYAICPN